MDTKTSAESGAALTSDQRLLTAYEAASYLGCSPLLLAKWRCTRTVDLPFVKLGRLVRYRVSDLQGFVAAQRSVRTDAQ